MEIISLSAAITLTEWSERTFWRRFADGSVKKTVKNGQSWVDFESIKAQICIPLNEDEILLIANADSGQAEAQNELGLLFLSHRKPKSAMYWFDLSAKQEYPDAMHWLSRCHIDGLGVPKNEDMGLMWLAKAAAHGHVISKAQIEDMKRRALGG